MPDSPFNNEDLKYPVHCHFKIIADDRKDIQEDLQKALLRLGVLTPLKPGNRSEKGTYITFNLELLVHSKEHMSELDTGIRRVKGVKMVL